MKLEVWFESVDGSEDKAIKFVGTDAMMVIIPNMGEKVGIWQDDATRGTNAFPLYFVVDVRHYVSQPQGPESDWVQEVHIMCGARR